MKMENALTIKTNFPMAQPAIIHVLHKQITEYEPVGPFWELPAHKIWSNLIINLNMVGFHGSIFDLIGEITAV